MPAEVLSYFSVIGTILSALPSAVLTPLILVFVTLLSTALTKFVFNLL